MRSNAAFEKQKKLSGGGDSNSLILLRSASSQFELTIGTVWAIGIERTPADSTRSSMTENFAKRVSSRATWMPLAFAQYLRGL